MIELKELKGAVMELFQKDSEFMMDLHKVIITRRYGDELVTKSYLDEALAKLAKEFDAKLLNLSKEFDAKLLNLSREFDAKLLNLSREFDAKLLNLSREFDAKLLKQTEELKKFFIDNLNARLGLIGGRWGEDAEKAVRNFAKELINSWGGEVKKWRKKKKYTSEDGQSFEKEYEIDIVVTDSKEILVEIKARTDEKDVERFVENIRCYETTDGKGKDIEKIILTFYANEESKREAEKADVKVVTV